MKFGLLLRLPILALIYAETVTVRRLNSGRVQLSIIA